MIVRILFERLPDGGQEVENYLKDFSNGSPMGIGVRVEDENRL